MNEELTLLPCPFKHIATDMVDLIVRQYCGCHKSYAGCYYVYCQTCGVHGSPYLTKEWAIEAWNQRAKKTRATKTKG